MTYSDADGNVTHEHTVKFRLEKYGPVRILDFYDMTTIVGPGAGNVDPDHFAFVYKVDGDTFLDCPGTFVSRDSYRNDPVVIVWRRPQSVQEVNAALEIEELGGGVTRNTLDRRETRRTSVLTGQKFTRRTSAAAKTFPEFDRARGWSNRR